MARSKLTQNFDSKTSNTQTVRLSKPRDVSIPGRSIKVTSTVIDDSSNEGQAEPTRQMTLRVNEAAWRELQMLRIETGRPVNKLLIDAVNEYLSRNGKAPVA